MWIEILCAVALLYGLISGWSNGLIKELCSMVGFFLGCFIAYYCYKHYDLGIGWALLLCIVFPIGLGWVGSLFSMILNSTPIAGTANKLLGALLGCAKYGLFIGFILNAVDVVKEWLNL